MREQIVCDFVQDLKDAKDHAGVRHTLRRVCDVFELESFCIGGVPLTDEPGKDYALLSGWPEEWFDLYMTTDRIHHDPVVPATFGTTDPIIWSRDLRVEQSTPQARLMNEAAEFGLIDGFSLAILHARGHQSIVTYAARKVTMDADRQMDLEVLSHFALRAAMTHGYGRGRRKLEARLLTDRQRECLQGVAKGEGVSDIGDRLGISDRTVEYHLEMALARLSARTRAQAVAIAKDFNII